MGTGVHLFFIGAGPDGAFKTEIEMRPFGSAAHAMDIPGQNLSFVHLGPFFGHDLPFPVIIGSGGDVRLAGAAVIPAPPSFRVFHHILAYVHIVYFVFVPSVAVIIRSLIS